MELIGVLSLLALYRFLDQSDEQEQKGQIAS